MLLVICHLMFERQQRMQLQNSMRKGFRILLFTEFHYFVFSLDPELKEELVLIIAKLLADKTIVRKIEDVCF